jgi:hypothetical protein
MAVKKKSETISTLPLSVISVLLAVLVAVLVMMMMECFACSRCDLLMGEAEEKWYDRDGFDLSFTHTSRRASQRRNSRRAEEKGKKGENFSNCENLK